MIKSKKDGIIMYSELNEIRDYASKVSEDDVKMIREGLFKKESFEDYVDGLKEEGREEGREEGIEKGREEGREEGIEEGKEEVVMNLIKRLNLPIDQIEEIVKMPREKILEIKSRI